MLTHWVIITSFISVQENPKVPDLARHEQAFVMPTILGVENINDWPY